MELTSKQRSQLRSLANSIDTIIHIGKDGISENLIKQADDALEARELIKGKVLDNNIEYDARLAAEELAKATRSEVVQVIGTKFVLYRETHSKPKEKRIQLVKPAKKKANPSRSAFSAGPLIRHTWATSRRPGRPLRCWAWTGCC